MSKSLMKRLDYNQNVELTSLMKLYAEGRVSVFDSGMKQHFLVAKQKPYKLKNHPPVLAISLGGTNMKLMIASMDGGKMVAEYVRTMLIPSKPIDFYDFFDGLMVHDDYVRSYLGNSDTAYLGFSFPMAVIDGVPYHPTKIPTLNGVIARNTKEICADLKFDVNFRKYMESRGFLQPKIFYQADGIIAHHGAVSLCKTKADESTMLVVCGTGLATGDEENYIQIGIAPMLNNDEELYPAVETENYQFHYAIAGKGLFGLMDRCIKIKSMEKESFLGKYDLHQYFMDVRGSKTVFSIWESGLENGKLEKEALEIFRLVGEKAFSELQEISEKIVSRVIGSLANSVVSTIIKMGPAENNQGHVVFFEGSIAVDKNVLPRLKSKILECINNKEFFIQNGIRQPFIPDMERPIEPLIPGKGISADKLCSVDITLIGAATSIIAESCFNIE